MDFSRWTAHRGVRVGLWGLAAGAALVLPSWLALPPLARHLAEKQASEQLGRTVRIGALGFKPWSLELTLRDLSIAGAAAGQPELLKVARIRVDAALQSVWRLAPVIDAIDIEAPAVHLTHLGDGRYDIDDIVRRFASDPAAPKPAGEPALFALYNLSLTGGSFDFEDRVDDKTHRLSELNLSLPFVSNLPSQREVKVLPRLDFKLDGAPVTTRAEALPFASNRKTDASFRLEGFDVGPYLGRLPADLPVRLRAGVVSADLKLSFEQAAQPEVRLSGELRAEKVKVADARGGELLGFEALKVALEDVRPLQRVVKLGRVALVRPQATVARGKDGHWAFESVATGKPAAAATAASAPVARSASAASAAASASGRSATPAEPAWQVAVAEVVVEDGGVRYADAVPSRPVSVELTGLQAGLKHFALGGEAAAPLPLTVSTRVKSGDADPGRIDWRGTLTLSPLAATGDLTVERLPVHQLSPYVADRVPVNLQRADAAFKGQVQFADTPTGPRVKVAGQASLDDLRAEGFSGSGDAARREPLLNWKTLALRGVNVALEPGQPLKVAVQDTLLSDFFARVIVTPQGRLNLQDLSGAPATEAATPAASGPAPVAAGKTAVASAPVATAPARAADAPVIDVGPIRVAKGRVLFSDRFIKPNYTTNLTELNGRLSAFGSRPPAKGAPPALAKLELRGKAEGTASLEITGELNPLAQPLVLDVAAKVRNLELAPLSPYAVKYSGYGIERGKLSVDVRYQVADGQLTATNNIVLNQLMFGDKVEGATQSLPVKLAVALLADRNGVIDIDLPISGSLSDPQFSLGSVIVKAVVNLIVKAVTAPFSLLAKAFGGGDGGGDDLAVVAFAPGSARLDAGALTALDKVAKALKDRGSLRLTAVGASSLDAERDGYRRERLNRQVMAEKRRALKPAEGVEVPPVTPAEYPELLRAVYKKADLKTKPRNLIGFAKDIPVPEMEALLMADMQVSEDDMRRLSIERSTVVRDRLAASEVPLERLFIGAPKVVSGAEAATGWKPRTELQLAMP